MTCPECGKDNPKRASFCMHCGNRLTLPPELLAVEEASRVLQEAEATYWQVVSDALAKGHSQRVVAKHGHHNHSVLSRKLARGEL